MTSDERTAVIRSLQSHAAGIKAPSTACARWFRIRGQLAIVYETFS
jgi:hypothetical protein